MIVIPKWLFALLLLLASPYAILLMSFAVDCILMTAVRIGARLHLWPSREEAE